MRIYSCLTCKNYIGKRKGIRKPICKAFPKGIPEKILTGEHDHTKPFKGDNGIRFEPVKPLERQKKKP